MSQRGLPVETFRKRFQIDVGSVDVIIDIVKRLIRDVSIRDHHRFQSVFLSGLAYIDDILAPDSRLVISKRQRIATMLKRQQRNIFRRNMLGPHLILPRFRNIPVLAKETPHVAPGRTHTEHTRSRQEMIQRFLLNRIDLQRRRSSVAQAVKFSTLIDTDETKSGLSRMNVAMPRTKVTMHAAASLRLPPAPFVQLVGFLEDLQLAHKRILLPFKSYASQRVQTPNCTFDEGVLTTGRTASGVVTNATLDTPPFCGPVHKTDHVGPVFPGKPQEFSRIQIIRFRTEECLKSPAQVRTLPGIQAIPACNVPVILQCL